MNRSSKTAALLPEVVFKDPQGRVPVSPDADIGYMRDGDKLSPAVRLNGEWFAAGIAFDVERLLNRLTTATA